MSHGYEAHLHRIGRWWAVDIPDAALHTQCRTLDEAEDLAREAIAEARGVQADTIAVELVVPEFASVLQAVSEARSRRAAADGAEQQAVADAARTLVEDLRVSQGDACRLLGVSHQEVSQLSTAPRGSADSRPWRLGPLSMPSAPKRQRPGPAIGTSDSSMTRPKRHRQASPNRPGWAIAEDDA
ncbi:hypothetical protein J7I98_38795 [Streptomyces sp. ISL-98]|uniref:hypothetical protein n=1 Tax=Streptomyces sp. ISL-98 TaxID=2819192 RepID=UPI001BEA8B7B|nr:hypothetical protein [Streptomyces sp. ISL-98]MBT2511629.1 hypothetical protein [Streptomyces sp. ISL-98]